MDNLDNKIYITQPDGIKKEYDLIAYLNIDSGNYVVYTDNKANQNGNVLMYVNCVVKQEKEIVFEEVDDLELQKVIAELQERMKNNE